MSYYKDYDDTDFNKMLEKYEFKEQDKKSYIYQEPRQLLISNLISKNTIYDSILLYWQPGTGKTCSSITIAEGFKEYVSNMGRKILVLVKNANIERNFRNELISKCTRAFGDPYIDQENPGPYFSEEERNKITRRINKMYSFVTYGSFVNQVLGIKQFKKDQFGRNTKELLKIDGIVQRKIVNKIENLNNTVIIIDEAHNVTNNDVYLALEKVLSVSINYRLVLLTGTPIYDNPREIAEISNLLNLNHPDNLLPIRNDLFKGEAPLMEKVEKFVDTKSETGESENALHLKGGVINITNYGKQKLIRALKGKVSYLRANTETFPDKIEIGIQLNDKVGNIKIVPCEMSDYQYSVYNNALSSDLKTDTKYDFSTIVQNIEANENLNESIEANVSKSSSLYKNSSDASTFVYPNGKYGKDGFLECFEMDKNKFRIKSEYKNILTTDLEKFSGKLNTLLKNVNDSDGNVFIYSNYVNFGGTGLIRQLLLNNGYYEYKGKSYIEENPSHQYKSFIMYDDSTNIETRERQRQILNSKDNRNGKYIKIIIGSPVLSEGITLKNIRQVHILEPSWNMSRINQIVGRAIRNHSHDDLEPDKRNVEIYKYCSVKTELEPIQDLKGEYPILSQASRFIDVQKYILAEEKDRSNKVVERMLKQIAFDCEINEPLQPTTGEGSADCDYTKCEYKCLIQKPKDLEIKNLDKSTYNMYIEFFDKFDIEYITNVIKKLYKIYFVWRLDDIIEKIKEREPSISNESIYTALSFLVDNKSIILDNYNRDGFIIQKGDYFIFNPVDKDINSSLYSKMLDFNVDLNKYNLTEFSKIKNIGVEIKEVIKEKRKKSFVSEISDEDIRFNNEILIKNKGGILGTYRDRGTKTTGIYGPIDNKFRIIDLRKQSEEDIEDKRKNISGMVITSFDKGALIEIIEYLGVYSKEMDSYLGFPNVNVNDLDKKQLATIIEKHLNKKELFLK